MDEPSFYSPELIDRTLRSWEVYRSRSEGGSSHWPEAHRHAEGKRYDPLINADRLADIDKAQVFALQQWGREWTLVDYRRRGFTLLAIADAMHLSKTTVHDGYWAGVRRMAAFLGWVEPSDSSVPEVC